MGKFIVKKTSDGYYMYNLKAENGEIILTDTGYSSKDNCIESINKVKKNCLNDTWYVKHDNVNESVYNPKFGRYHFNLIDENGDNVGHSELYEQVAGMINGIDSVKENAPDAIIKDE